MTPLTNYVITFLLGSLTVTLLDLFLSSDTSICSTMAFPPLGNSDHVVISLSIDFPINSKQDAPFHHIAYDYSPADQDGICDHLKDVPWKDIFKLSPATASEFCEWLRLEFIYIFLTISIRSNFTHLHGFSSLCCCHSSYKSFFFVCTNRINLLDLK